jgi:hypothetical protein
MPRTTDGERLQEEEERDAGEKVAGWRCAAARRDSICPRRQRLGWCCWGM